MTPTPMPSDSQSLDFCRICRNTDTNLVNVCQCKGTVGYMHLECLKQSIESRVNDSCEICNTPYKIPIIWRTPGCLTALKHLTRPLLLRFVLFVLFFAITLLLVVTFALVSEYRHWYLVGPACITCSIAMTALYDSYKIVLEHRSHCKPVITVKQVVNV